MVALAIDLDVKGLSRREIEEMLREEGASSAHARKAIAQAWASLETEVFPEPAAAAVDGLPAAVALPLNFYFALGLTPRASSAAIKRAYRVKASLVHPDRHHDEFTLGVWTELMRLFNEVIRVLGDPDLRAAYDALLAERGHAAKRLEARRGETRSDWETRSLWEMAEIGAGEDRILALLEEPLLASTGTDLEVPLQAYTAQLFTLNLNLHSLAEHLADLERWVRAELGRKERLKAALESSLAPSAEQPAKLRECRRLADEVRKQHHLFDIRVAARALGMVL